MAEHTADKTSRPHPARALFADDEPAVRFLEHRRDEFRICCGDPSAAEPATEQGTLLPGGEQACNVGWQPMGSAPRDGTEVLLRVDRRAGIPGSCLVGHYMPRGHCIKDHPVIDSGWYFWTGMMFDKASKPVLWMPIPGAAEREGKNSPSAVRS